jgi:hypothetical protein
MSYNEATRCITLVAGADFRTTGINRFCVVGTDGKAEIAGANARAIGVIYDNPPEDEACTVAVAGVVQIEVGSGGLTAGDIVQCAANGLVVTQSSTNPRLGIAMESAVQGDIASVFLKAFA